MTPASPSPSFPAFSVISRLEDEFDTVECTGLSKARGCSPNTLTTYAYDPRHLWIFLAEQHLEWDELRPRHALGLLEYLRSVPSRSPRQRFALTVATLDVSGPGVRLAPTTVKFWQRSFLRVRRLNQFAVDGDIVEKRSAHSIVGDPIGVVAQPALRDVQNTRGARIAERVENFVAC